MLVHNLWISLKITPCSYKLSFSRNKVILFENLFKPRQRRLTVCMVTDFVSSIHNLKTVF